MALKWKSTPSSPPRPSQPKNDKYPSSSTPTRSNQEATLDNPRTLSLRELVIHARAKHALALLRAKSSLSGSETLEDLALMYDRACDRIMTKLTDKPSGPKYKKANAAMVMTERHLEKLEKVSKETAIWVAFMEGFEMWAERFGRITGEQAYIMVEGYIMLDR